MKKILVSMFLLVFGLCLVGCEQIGVNIKFDNTSSINKIEITEYDVSEGYIVNSITLEDTMQINYICNNFTSLKLRKITDTNKPTSIKYNFVFFNDDNEVEIIGITAHNWIDYKGCFHSIQQGEIDFNFINNLSKKSYKLTIQNETDYELIGIKNEYKVGEEVEVKMIYEDDVCTFAFLDGKLLGELNGTNSIKFNMPTKDSVLIISYSEDIYKVNVIDNFELLIIPLKQYYASGETVQVITKFLSGPRIDVQVDGQFLEIKELEAFGYYGYEFIMPEKDVEIVILYNGLMNKPCENAEHQWDEGVEIDTGTGAYVMEYTCQLCGNKKRENITLIPSENEILSDFLVLINPNCVYLNSESNHVGKISSYKNFKEQLFFNNFSQIELNALDDNLEYEVAQVDYYIKFVNSSTDEFVILELFDVIGNNKEYFYGWLKTSYLNGIFEFQIEANLFEEIYDYFGNDIKSVNYYAFENGDYIETSNYSCQKITNIILESEEITYKQSEILTLVLDLSITTYESISGVYPIEMSKYNYVWRLDYETGIAEFCTIAPVISSQLWPNRYFKLSQEEVAEIKDILAKQSYEIVNDYGLLSFYKDTMLINDVDGFPIIAITQDVATTERFEGVHKRYNEEFFNEYALMIIKFETNSTEKILGIGDIKFDGNKFTAIFDITPGPTDDYVVKYFILKIKKSTLPVLNESSYDVEIKVNNLNDPTGGSQHYDKYTK